jgi:MFS family permease
LWYRDRPEDKPGVNKAELALIQGRPIVDNESTMIRAGQPLISAAAEELKPADDHKPVRTKVPWGKLFTDRNLWTLCIMYFMGAYGWYFNITYLPNYLKEYHGVTRGVKWSAQFWEASLMTGMPLLLGSVACLLGGIMSDLFIRTTGNRKWGRRLFGIVGKGLCSVCFFCCIFVDSAWGIVWAVSLAAFFNDLTMGAAWASCLDIGGKFSGIVAGCMNSVGNLGGALAGLVTGWIITLYTDGLTKFDPITHELNPAYKTASIPGWTCNFMVFGCVYFVAMLLWFWFDSTKQVAQE